MTMMMKTRIRENLGLVKIDIQMQMVEKDESLISLMTHSKRIIKKQSRNHKI